MTRTSVVVRAVSRLSLRSIPGSSATVLANSRVESRAFNMVCLKPRNVPIASADSGGIFPDVATSWKDTKNSRLSSVLSNTSAYTPFARLTSTLNVANLGAKRRHMDCAADAVDELGRAVTLVISSVAFWISTVRVPKDSATSEETGPCISLVDVDQMIQKPTFFFAIHCFPDTQL